MPRHGGGRGGEEGGEGVGYWRVAAVGSCATESPPRWRLWLWSGEGPRIGGEPGVARRRDSMVARS